MTSDVRMVDGDALGALAGRLRSVSGELGEARGVVDVLFSAGKAWQASSVAERLGSCIAWADRTAGDIDWRLRMLQTARLASVGQIPALAIPGPYGTVAEFLSTQPADPDTWEEQYRTWMYWQQYAQAMRARWIAQQTMRLTEAYEQAWAEKNGANLATFAQELAHYVDDAELVAAFFEALGPQATALIALGFEMDWRLRDVADDSLSVYASGLAAALGEGELDDGFWDAFVAQNGWSVGQFLTHATFDTEYLIDYARIALSMKEDFQPATLLWWDDFGPLANDDESMHPRLLAYLALAGDPDAALAVLGEYFAEDTWNVGTFLYEGGDQTAAALAAALSVDDPAAVNALGLAFIEGVIDTGFVSPPLVEAAVGLFDDHFPAFADAAARDFETGIVAASSHAGVVLPKETAWQYLTALMGEEEAVAAVATVTTVRLSEIAYEGVDGDSMDWAGQVGGVLQLTGDSYASALADEAKRKDASQAFMLLIGKKVVGLVSLPGGPVGKVAGGVLIDSVFKGLQPNNMAAVLDASTDAQIESLGSAALVIAAAYHAHGLTDPEAIEQAVAFAERYHPGEDAAFLDGDGTILGLEEMSPAQLLALSEWIELDAGVWLAALQEADRTMGNVADLTQVTTPR